MKSSISLQSAVPSAFKTRVDRYLERLLADAAARAGQIDPEYARLLDVVRDQVLWGGKRLRPFVLHTAYLGYGGTDGPDVLAAAASQELIHNFLLIHDDVIDRDTVRHGRPNVAGTYEARFGLRGIAAGPAAHHAASFAILAGNAALALALQAILDTRFPADRKLAATARLQRMLFEEMGGQLSDVTAALPGGPAPTLDQLLRVCRYKTASYSFEAPLLAGAELAGAPEPAKPALEQFGRALGVAFQLTDDLLGVYGRPEALGKPILSDLQEGKRTVLIHFALASATPAQRRHLGRIWGDPQAGPAELEVARGLLADTGARARTIELAETHLRDSLAALDSAGLTPHARSQLAAVANFCVQRDF